MNIAAAFVRRKTVTPYAGQTGTSAPFTDVFNRGRAPSAIELIRENLGTAYACATLNADLVASTPLRLYVKTRKGESKSRLSKRGDTRPVSTKSFGRLNRIAAKQVADAADLEEVVSHPVLDLLAKPNMMNEDGTGMSGFTLADYLQLFQEIVGRCYLWKDKSGIGNTPSSLWILAPQRVKEIPSYGKNDRIIDFYEFSGGAAANVRYEVDEVAPFRMPDLENVYTGGVAPLRAVFEQVKLARKVDAQTNNILDTGGKPSAVWSPAANGEVAGVLGRDEAARARKAFQQAFTRAGAGGVMVQENAGTLQMLNWPMKDIIDSSRIELSVDVICNAFGVPTTKLKRNDANRASAETGDYAHARDAGLPRCRRNEAALNTFIIPDYGAEAKERLFFVYDDPPGLHDDAADRAEFDKAATGGSVTRNEVRLRLGMPKMPWGDQPLAPSTMVAVDLVTGIPDKPTVSSFNPIKGPRTARRKTIVNDPETGIARTLPQGAAIVAIMHRVFGEQRRVIMAQIQDHHEATTKASDADQTLPEAFVSLAKWSDQIARDSKPIIEVIMRQEGQKLLTQVDAALDKFVVFEKNIPKAAEKLALDFAQSTNETTSMKLDDALAKLRQEIGEGLVQGDTRQELTNRVQKIFDEADASRAETIARTEASRAAHNGELMGAKDSGVVSRKFWLLSADACPVCDEIAAANPDGVRLDEEFAPGINSPPDSHPNCQCSLTYSIRDDGK